MVRWKIAWLIVVGILLIQCQINKDPIGSTSDPQAKELAVYRDLITATYSQQEKAFLVILDSTAVPDIVTIRDTLLNRMKSLKVETMDNYNQLARQAKRIESIPGLTIPYAFISRRNAYKWKDQYPDATVRLEFSRVGFDTTGEQALVYMSQFWAPLAAEGSLYLLKKINGIWVIQEQFRLWVS